MVLKCLFIGLGNVLAGVTASVIIMKTTGNLTNTQAKQTLKSWFLIGLLFALTVAGIYFAHAFDWETNSPIRNLVNLRIPSIADKGITISLYPLPVITSMLLSLLLFFLISVTKTVTAVLKINPAQTDKRLLDYFHFKELLYIAVGIFLFKIVIYFSAIEYRVNGIIAAVGLLLAIAALFYEILRWVHYPGFHDGLKWQLHCCHVTGIVILCFAFCV